MVNVEIDTTYDAFVQLTDAEKTKMLVKATEQKLLEEKQLAEQLAAEEAARLKKEQDYKALEAEFQARRAELDKMYQ